MISLNIMKIWQFFGGPCCRPISPQLVFFEEFRYFLGVGLCGESSPPPPPGILSLTLGCVRFCLTGTTQLKEKLCENTFMLCGLDIDHDTVSVVNSRAFPPLKHPSYRRFSFQKAKCPTSCTFLLFWHVIYPLFEHSWLFPE